MAGVLLLFAASMSFVIDIIEKKTEPGETTESAGNTAD